VRECTLIRANVQRVSEPCGLPLQDGTVKFPLLGRRDERAMYEDVAGAEEWEGFGRCGGRGGSESVREDGG
jgi:hypothetical protein